MRTDPTPQTATRALLNHFACNTDRSSTLGIRTFITSGRSLSSSQNTSILQDFTLTEEFFYCFGCQLVGQLVGMVVGDVHPQAIGPHPAIDFQEIESR